MFSDQSANEKERRNSCALVCDAQIYLQVAMLTGSVLFTLQCILHFQCGQFIGAMFSKGHVLFFKLPVVLCQVGFTHYCCLNGFYTHLSSWLLILLQHPERVIAPVMITKGHISRENFWFSKNITLTIVSIFLIVKISLI